MKFVFVFVLGFVFVILKGKFIDLKLVFLISVFVFALWFRDGQDGTGLMEPAGPGGVGLGLEKKPVY